MAPSLRIDIPVKGMHCAACVARIEEAVREVPGVKAASVNLASEPAAIEAEASVDARALDDSVRRRGYRLVPRRLLYRVGGLTTPEAIAGIERELATLPGVVAARINYAAQTASIDVIPGLERPEEIAAAATRAGWRISPLKGALEAERDWTWLKVAVSLPIAAVVMALGMRHEHGWIAAVLAGIVQVWAAWEYHAGFLAGLRRFSADMNTLVSVGTNVAYGASLWLLWRGEMPWFDTSATIIAIVLLGRWLERRARRGTRAAVEALVELTPRVATLADGREVPLDQVRPGDDVLVKPGARVPADGVVIEGASAIDESMLTGESRPVDKKAGDAVIGGTVNTSGALRVKVSATGEQTVLAQIVRTVREAQGSKAPAQRIADLWAGRFVPIVLLVALATLGTWLAVDPSKAVMRTVAVLVVACPCALGLATPVAIVVASGAAARRGILIKDAEMLELPARVDAFVFDKTGTLTVGRPVVTSVVPAAGFSKDDVLRLAAAVERSSEHPLARAIVEATPPGPRADDFKARPGLGALATLDGVEIAVGSRQFLALLDVNFAPIQKDLTFAVASGETAVLVARGTDFVGMIALADAPRDEAAAVVGALRARGRRVVMLTGDDGTTAGAVAARLGIDDVIPEVMPADKAAKVKDYQDRALKVAMIGDGVNDAPALAQADVGIALATGTDVAIESAGIVLVKGGLAKVPAILDLSLRTRAVIHQNFAWAFGFNAILIPLAAIGVLHPMAAAAAMAVSSLTVVLNSLRLRTIA
jgi:Cu+-exporting ATPase